MTWSPAKPAFRGAFVNEADRNVNPISDIADCKSGDLVLVFSYYQGTTSLHPPPGGYTLLSSAVASGVSDSVCAVYYKQITGAEGDLQFASGSDSRRTIIAVAYGPVRRFVIFHN